MKLNIDSYQLFLFDFDGLLVDTERLHYLAYKNSCQSYGIDLKWTFQEYASYSLFSADGLKNSLIKEFPQLLEWTPFYQNKARCYIEILENSPIELMPGAKELLERVFSLQKKCCVVTHSARSYTTMIQEKIPLLKNIPHWITKEDYPRPKPAPDGFQLAIDRYGAPHDKIIGFEDSPKGLSALLQCPVTPVFVNQFNFPEIPTFISLGATHLHSLKELTQEI